MKRSPTRTHPAASHLRRTIALFLLAQTIFQFLQVFYLTETQLWMGNLLNHLVILLYLTDLTRRFGTRLVDVAGLLPAGGGAKKPGSSARDFPTVHMFLDTPLYFSNEGTGFGVALFVIANYLEHMSVFRGQPQPQQQQQQNANGENNNNNQATAARNDDNRR